MAYYDPLIAKWATLTPGTTAAKLAQINALTVQITAHGVATLTPSQILNAIVFADLAALTQLQVSQLTLLLQGQSVDASFGSVIRLGIQTLFAGKTTTLANLGALVAPFDLPVSVPWWQATVAQGGGGYHEPVGMGNLSQAGGLV
jgi:hypothetical protein